MGLPAVVQEEKTIEDEVADALSLCKGDAMMALRVTLIANAFLEAQLDELKQQVSAGFTRRRKPCL